MSSGQRVAALAWVLAWVMLTAAPSLAVVPIPIAGSSPEVMLSLTKQQAPGPDGDLDANSYPSSTRTNILPTSGTYYAFAIYDTGAPLHVLSRDAYTNFGIAAAGLSGNLDYALGIGGAGGDPVLATPSDPLGVYVAGLQSVTGTSPLAINTSLFKGEINTSIVYAPPVAPDGSNVLPNIVGTPLSMLYTTVIDYSNPQIFSYNGRTHRSPALNLYSLGSPPTVPTKRIGLTLAPGPLGVAQPTFIHSFDGAISGGPLNDNPQVPTVAGSFFLSSGILTHQSTTMTSVQMLLDTGAQGSIVSQQMAADLGFFVEVDDPDFVVRIAGVTGTAEEVPGFYVDQLRFNTTGGALIFNNVPLIVYDLPDPRDSTNTLPMLLGMNVFADRTVTINPVAGGGAYLGVSDPVLATHTWNAPSLDGAWATTTNWSANGTPGLTWVADVVNPNGLARNANVTADSAVNLLHVQGNAAAMDLRIQNGARLTVFGSAIIEDDGYVTLQNGGILDAQTVELRGGTIRGNGTLFGEAISQGTIAPGAAAGTLTINGSFDQLQQGTLEIQLGGRNAGTQYDQLVVTGLVSLAGTIDVSLIGGFTPVLGQLFTVLTAQDISGTFDNTLADFDLLYDDTAVVLRALTGIVLAGDANNDGIVDAMDTLMVETHFGDTGTADGTLLGDANDDGRVDGADVIWVERHFGSIAPGSFVPEPGTALLLVVSVIALGGARRRTAGR